MNQVLVVDDDDLMRRTLGRMLAELPCKIVYAAGGQQAIGLLEKMPFAAVLTDLQMPTGDGFSVLRSAKKLQPDTPVIILTASGNMSDSVRAMREGAANFLRKPLHAGDLKVLVEKCLQGASPGRLAGFITERHFELAEEEFPGITRFYSELEQKPTTFLSLMCLFELRA